MVDYAIKPNQLSWYYRPQQGLTTAWIALVTWYMCSKLAYKNIVKLLTQPRSCVCFDLYMSTYNLEKWYYGALKLCLHFNVYYKEKYKI